MEGDRRLHARVGACTSAEAVLWARTRSGRLSPAERPANRFELHATARGTPALSPLPTTAHPRGKSHAAVLAV